MTQIFDWQKNRDMWIRVLEKQTGKGLETWNASIAGVAPASPAALRDWLGKKGVSGYAQTLLTMETFGYPDFIATPGSELIDRQYEDRPGLRPVYDAVLTAAMACGTIAIQARKTYVSILTPKRTFARLRASTASRVDLALRLAGVSSPRLSPSNIHPDTPVQVGLGRPEEVDQEVQALIRSAYIANI